MTKIFSWKAILTQDEHKMPPTLPPCSWSCFNNTCLTKSHHFRSTGQNPTHSHNTRAFGSRCLMPSAASATRLRPTGPDIHRKSSPEAFTTYKTRSIPHPGDQKWWRGAARNPGKVHQGSYDAGQNLILVHLLSIAEPICFSQHPTCKRNINCGQNQDKVDSLTVLDLTGNVCFKWVSIRS